MQVIVAKHVTRCSIFSALRYLDQTLASIGVTHSYSSCLFLCALGTTHQIVLTIWFTPFPYVQRPTNW